MAERFDSLDKKLTDFIEEQRIFFVGTAAPDGRVNISPKGMDSLRVLGPNRLVWLNYTGSGNETATHLLQSNRMTIMFCAFNGAPLILRLYGQANTMHHDDEAWLELIQLFPDYIGARQIFDMEIDLVQTSCGFAVPNFDYVDDRDTLARWAAKKGEAGIRDYWQEKNKKSLDGFDTDIT